MARSTARGDDPLRALENMVGVVVVALVLLASGVLVGTIVGPGSIPGVDAAVCVTTSEDGMPGFRRVEGEWTGPVGLAEGVTWSATEVTLCDPDPDGATRAVAAVGLVVWAGAPLLFFVLLWRTLRRARREGVFGDRVPGALRRLGGLLLGWAALDFVVTGLVRAELLEAMTEGLVRFTSSDFPGTVALMGVALLALGRVMAQAVGMRHEVEATI